MMKPMQSYRGRSQPPADHSHGHNAASSSSSRGSMSNNQHRNFSSDSDSRYHENANRSHARPSHSNSSRWAPPKRNSYPPPASASACWGESTRNNIHANSQGGGKVNRQRRHSNDTHHQRNQYRQRLQKNIITPEEPANPSNSQKPPTADETMPKLDPSDSKQARRIQQRRRQVFFGKNTAGYEEYTKKIPRHKRRPRSLECPMTPDHTLDIPAKRWQGLMNAWRRSLHKYDPPDLHLRQPAQNTITLASRPCVTDADKAQEEIAQAKASGLQVAFGSMNVGKEAGMFSVGVADEETNALANGTAVGSAEKTEAMPFEEEAAYRQTTAGGIGGEAEQMDGGFLEDSDSDSDDDVL